MPVEKIMESLEDQRKPRTSELFGSETLKHFIVYTSLNISHQEF